MSLVGDVLQRVRVHAAQRRLRLNDFFTDFDKLNSGRITAGQLRRALAVNNIPVSDEEFDAITDAFAAPYTHGGSGEVTPRGAGSLVSYTNFLQALQAEEPPPELLTTLKRKPNSLSDAEEAQLRAAMQSIRDISRVRGLQLRKCFEDFDHFRSGKVSASVFRRCIPFEGLREEVIKLFIKKYKNEDGDVLYSAWCNDIEDKPQEMSQHSPTAAPLKNFLRSRSGFHTVDGLLRMLREQFSMYHLRCDDYLRDYDHFKTGFVTAPQFESALGQLRLVDAKLTAENIAMLTRAYADESTLVEKPGMDENPFVRVNYVQFLADTNPRHTEADGGSANYLAQTRAPGQFIDATNQQEQQQTEAVLRKVRQIIRSNRIHLVPTMHDFDRARKGIYEHRTCTASRFIRSLATHKIFLKPEEIELLVRRYSIRAPDGGPADEVNYFQFVMDVDEVKWDTGASRILNSSAMAELQKSVELSRPLPADTVVNVLVKIAMQAEERHLRVSEFFFDFDPLRGGTVQTDKFIVALGIAGVKLHPSEADLLKKEYASTKVRDHVDTNRFIADIGQVAPSAVPSVSTRYDFTASRSAKGEAAITLKETIQNPDDKLTAAELEELGRLRARLSHDVSSHQALLLPFFADFDRFHRAKITRTNFQQGLARHRFALTAAEIDLLSRYYAAADDKESIEYRRFVGDIGLGELAVGEFQKTINGNGATFTASLPASTCAGSTQRNVGDEEKFLDEVLLKICYFLQERKPRLAEFFPDGDELRHRHVTNSRFRHCLSILGIELTEEELRVLEISFAHPEMENHVDYPTFLAVVTHMLQNITRRMGPQQRNDSGSATTFTAYAVAGNSENLPHIAAAPPAEKATEEGDKSFHASVMDRVRRTLASRRSVSLPAFRQYDRARKGFVKEGQFFATLMSLGVQLSPAQADVLRKTYSIGGGEMGYVHFSAAVDDPRFE
ncbi:EF-hand domain containing protein, putative [Trypanosoma equiperdum]|uniref:EF-hand domain containing protein, putative n=1 Tax=Trypanosoma equiperdum TaxID=5694 RepID=A0A1G4IF57_TRYEQ|nr:EF-hand domain containing protein, putative [Trypanosoma equiperdum]